jgi:parallel beta-helix repeat protein
MVSNKILISIFVILLNTGFASAATLNVGQGQAYTTIQSAIDAANTGDVISVNEGTYYENPVVKKNGISIIGKSREKTIIDGKKTGSVIKIDQANNVKVSGFTIQNSGGSGQSDAGISLYRANNNEIANAILVNNVVGISIYSGSNSNIVSGNDIRSNGKYGIFIYSSNDNRIYNNDIQNNKFGIYADSAKTNRIYSNNFIDNTEQAYDNSGANSWDDGKSGNYWNNFKGSGEFSISGAGKAKDNYPLTRAVTIKEEAISTPAEQKTPEEAGKSTPGFAGIVALVSVIAAGILLRKRG